MTTVSLLFVHAGCKSVNMCLCAFVCVCVDVPVCVRASACVHVLSCSNTANEAWCIEQIAKTHTHDRTDPFSYLLYETPPQSSTVAETGDARCMPMDR